MRSLQACFACALFALPLTTASAAQDCTLKKAASFDARIDTGMLEVKANIDGKDVWIVLDTGAPFSMINNALVADLKLPTNHGYWTGVDAAGHESNLSATVHKLTLGAFFADNVEFLVAGRDPDGHGVHFDALLGDNFLEMEGIDLELDLAHGKVNLFLSDHCPGQGVYWAHEYVPIPIRIQDQGHIYLPVTLEGHETYAMLDTGSSLSLVDKHFAEGKLNVPFDGGKDKMDGNLTAGTGATLPYYKHTFGTFDIGGIAFHNTEMGVSYDRMNRDNVHRNSDPHVTLRHEDLIDAPVILGLRQLMKLRLYFSWKEEMLYATPANAQ